jgi:hypothetical protein
LGAASSKDGQEGHKPFYRGGGRGGEAVGRGNGRHQWSLQGLQCCQFHKEEWRGRHQLLEGKRQAQAALYFFVKGGGQRARRGCTRPMAVVRSGNGDCLARGWR